MKTLTKSQRDYFIGRINENINKEIQAIEQINATAIETTAQKQYKAYLKETKLDRLIKKYTKLESRWKGIENEMQNVCEALHERTEYPGKSNYFNRPYNTDGVHKFLKQICTALAREGFINTPKGRRLKELETKKQAATDVVMGMTKTSQVVQEINKVLGKDMRLLGSE